ncbi:hypothetical protein Tbd_2426 [Thiobacillus denitrificans ATCC 25259]|uniref:Thioredoxin domain-containing protein n=2 Tax=Thiobacillus denitrificans TaxID=36861 RepID=Q3SES2_THIDA|nr:hypothetical protein Tbd_2426 [Thiobacillus denitrificans ATCC 25259]
MMEAARAWRPSPPTLILLGLIAYLWVRPPAEVSDENRIAPPWHVALTEVRVLTSEAREGRVVLVDFRATGCPYCRKEKPVIERFWPDHRDPGFEVVSISVDDLADRIAACTTRVSVS